MAESKYTPLATHLAALNVSEWQASFADMEAILGFSLPDSAHLYAAWWANHASGSRHTSAWLDKGWRAEELNLDGGQVTFRRGATSVTPPGADETGCRLGMAWIEQGAIIVDAAGMLKFPDVPKTEAIYRLTIRWPDDSVARYIGETNNLVSRMRDYRKPGGESQTTNVRINKKLLEALSGGATVTMAAVTADAWLEVGGGRLAADLSSKSVRLLLESAAILATPDGVEMLNLAD